MSREVAISDVCPFAAPQTAFEEMIATVANCRKARQRGARHLPERDFGPGFAPDQFPSGA
jgi:hypothetical protein